MSGFKKALFLFLALLLPVIVFVFLKLFGKNEFTVEPLFQEEIEIPVTCDSFSYNIPYTIPDSILVALDWNKTDSATLIIFDDLNQENRVRTHAQIERITKEFESEKLTVLCVVDSGESTWLNNIREHIKIVEQSHEKLMTTMNCVFLLDGLHNAVIIDSKKRIMGQYDLNDLEDADRLYVHELNILFKRY